MASGSQTDTLTRIRRLEVKTGINGGTDTGIVIPSGVVELAGHDDDVGQSVAGPLQIVSMRNDLGDPPPGSFGGTPLFLQQDDTMNYRGAQFIGPKPYSDFQNPWTAPGLAYGVSPAGPKALLTVAGTQQWEFSSGFAGAHPLLYFWNTFKNAHSVAANIGSQALIAQSTAALADGASINIAAAPDIIAPNIASEYFTNSYSGYWGWVSNQFYGTINSGTLSASGAEDIGFLSAPMFFGNVTFGTRKGFQVNEAWVTTSDGHTPTVARQVGMYMQPLTAAATNISLVVNNGIQAFDVDRTFTSAPFLGLGNGLVGGSWLSFQNKFTLNFANSTLGSVFNWNPTVELAQTAASFGTVAVYVATGTYQNTSGVTAALGNVTALFAGPTFKALGAVTINGGAHHTIQSQPTFSRTSSGTFSVFTTYTDYESDLTVSTGAFVQTRYGWKFNDAVAGSVRLDSQYGVYIPALLGAANNYGVYNASTTVWPDTTQTITGASSTIGVVSTAVTLNNTHGSGVILGSTPTIAAGVDGETVTIYNTSAHSVALLDDSSGLAGTLVKLAPASGTAAVLNQYESIVLRYDTTLAKWLEIGGRHS